MTRTMRWPLQYQIFIPLAVVMVGMVLAVSGANAFVASRRAEEQIGRQIDSIVRTIAGTTFPLTDGVLRQIRGLSGAEFVLTDLDGKTLVTTRASRGDLAIAPAHRQDQGLSPGAIEHVGSKRYFHSVVRLGPRAPFEGDVVLHLLYPEEDWRQARWQAAYPSLLVGCGALVLVFVLAALFARRLSRPMVQIGQQIARVADGNFEALEVPRRNDELRDLVLSVNGLAEQLEKLRRTTRQSERLALLGQLSAGTTHHLRNTLTGARAAVQLHQRSCSDGDEESLDVALRELTLAEDQLRGLLALGRPEGPQPMPCSLAEIAGDASQLLRASCEHRGVRFETKVLSSGPVLGDRRQLRQAVTSLLMNAVDAAGTGGWVCLELDSGRDGGSILRVLDSGPGPTAAVRDRLFEPFVTSKPEGVGIGLAVARQIADMHQGRLEYYSRDGTTCFELRLPSPSSDHEGTDEALTPSGSARLP